MSWLPRLLARSIRASSSSHARTTSAPAPASVSRGGAGECPRFPVTDPLDRDVVPDDPDAERTPADDPDPDDTRRAPTLCAVPGRAPGAGNTSGCCGFMYRYGNGASPDPARAIVFRFVVSVIPAPPPAPVPCGSGGTSTLMRMLSRPRSCGPALVCGRRLFFRVALFVGDPATDPLARGSTRGAGLGLGTGGGGGGSPTGSVPTATAASAVLGGTYAPAKVAASGAASRTRASSAPADDDPGAVAARRRSAERACASAKCALACRRSASFVSTALSSRGARSTVSVPVVGDVTITCGLCQYAQCSKVECSAEAGAKAEANEAGGRTLTRTQKLTLASAPFMLSPIDQRLWLRDSGHWRETVLLYMPVAASSANEGKVAAATDATTTLSDGANAGDAGDVSGEGEPGLYACEPELYELDDMVGVGEGETGGSGGVGGRSGERDVTVLADAVECSVDVLCDAWSELYGSSAMSRSRSGRLLESVICGGRLRNGTCRYSVLVPASSMRRSTRSDALRIETAGSCGRTKSDVKRRSAGPMGYGGVERL